MATENDSPRRGSAPTSLIPLPSFMRSAFELKGPVPIAVEPGFLLLTAYIGYVVAGSPARANFAERVVVAAVVAAFSVFWHECGHAAAVLAFGGRPKITLVATGGATTSGRAEPEFRRDLIVSASGPLAGFLLYLLAGEALRLDAVVGRRPLLFFALAVARGANWIWTLLNLVPAMPMDGGNLLRILFLRIFGPSGLRHTYRWSFGVCAALVAYALFETDWLFAFFAFSMAAGNLRTFRALAQFSDAEMAPEIQGVLARVGGLEREGKWAEAYDLLLPLAPVLGSRNICALASLACRTGRHRKAVDLCEPLHAKRGRDHAIAFVLARAHAGRGDLDSAVKWLSTAISEGLANPPEAVEACEEFKPIMADPAVRAALFPLSSLEERGGDGRL